MTKKLEELFNLEEKAVANEKPNTTRLAEEVDSIESVSESYEAIAAITKDLPSINELDALGEQELDDLAAKAEAAYDDLMDLGMNVEVRYSSRIFEVASSMLGHAITAKSNKLEKKLKAVDLQLKKYKIDKDNNEDPNNLINGQGYVVLDRNEMLKKLGKKD